MLVINVQFKLSYKLLDCVKAFDGHSWVTASPQIKRYQMHDTTVTWEPGMISH